jgi:hypothetical protein
MSFPKIYTVNGPSSTSSATLPSWIAVKQRPRTVNGQRKRTKTQHTVGQLELVQDFAFPQAANKIKTTPDGLHAMGTGTYKPMVKVWDLEQLSVKFERVTDAENVDFVVSSCACMRRQMRTGKLTSSSCRTTGPRRCICRETARYHYTPKGVCTTLSDSRHMVAHSHITPLQQMR